MGNRLEQGNTNAIEEEVQVSNTHLEKKPKDNKQ